MSKNWPMVKLGDMLTSVSRPVNVQADEPYRQIGIRSHGKGVFHKEPVSGFDLGNKKVFWVEPGDFVLNIVFAWEGAVAIMSKSEAGMIGSHRFPCFRADEARLDSRFLLSYFKTPTGLDLLGRISPGGAGRNRTLSRKAFLEQSIPLPSLAEQRRVVARIEELSAQIHEARKLRKEAAEEAEALVATRIKMMFDSGKTAGWSNGILGDYVIGDCYGTSEKTHEDALATPVLRMGNIQNGILDIRNLKYLHIPEKDRNKLILRRGDIVVNRTNSAELVGKCAVFDLEGEFSFASYLIRLRLDQTQADPRLVAAYINSPGGRAYMFSEKKQMTGQANVNSTKLKALPLSLPPLPEQRRIVAELDALQAEVDALKRLQAETSAELDALLPAILDRAFKGEF